MKSKLVLCLLSVFALSLIPGCGSSNPEDAVRAGTLKMDSSVTVGDVFKGYRYFQQTSWKSFEDPQKRKIVEFNGLIDFDKFAGAELNGIQITQDIVARAKQKLNDIKTTYVAQFAISIDGKSFELKHSAIRLSGTNRETGKYVENDQADQGFIVLQHIYANKPEPVTFGLLVGASD